MLGLMVDFERKTLVALGLTVACCAPALDAASEPDAERGFLGIRYIYETVPEGDGAFRIDGVLPEGPAGRAGVERGDLVVRVNGESYRNDAWDPETADPFAWVRPGDALELEILRGEPAKRVSVQVVAEKVPNIDRLRRSRGNAPAVGRADAALDRLARDGAVLEVDGSAKSIRRLDGPLDPAERQAIEHLFFEASGLGLQLAQEGEPGPRRVRLSLDPGTGHLRFDTVSADAAAVEPDDR